MQAMNGVGSLGGSQVDVSPMVHLVCHTIQFSKCLTCGNVLCWGEETTDTLEIDDGRPLAACLTLCLREGLMTYRLGQAQAQR